MKIIVSRSHSEYRSIVGGVLEERVTLWISKNAAMHTTHVHGEIIVIGHREVGQLAQVHVPSSDGVHDEDVRGEAQRAACRCGGRGEQ